MTRFPNLALTLACAALPLAPAHAGFEEALPAETLAYLGVDDVTVLKEGFQASAWGRFLKDQAFQSFQDWLSSEMADLGAQAKEETGTDPFELLKLVEGPAGVFLLDVADPDRTSLDGGEVPVAIGVLLGLGENGDAFLDKFDTLWQAEVDDGNVLLGSEEIAGVEVTLVTDADENADNPMEMRYGVKDGTFVLTMISAALADRAFFESICAGLDGLVEETLDQTDGYAASIAAQGAGTVRGFANVREIVRRAVASAEKEGRMGPDERKLFDSFGFADLGTAALVADVASGGSRTDFELTWSGQGHLAEMLQSVFGPAELVTPRYVPADSVSMTAFRFDLGKGIDAAMRIMRELEPDDAAEAEAMMEMFFEQDGFNVRTDVIDNLAGEVSFFQAKVEDELEALPGTEEDPVSVAILLPMTDGTKLEVAIDTLLRQTGMHATRRRDEFQGVAVFNVPFPLFGSGIHYAITNDLLTLSLSRSMLEDVLRRHGGGDLPTVATSDAWVEATELLDGRAPTSIGFQDAAESVKGMLEALNVLASGEIPGVSVGGAPARRPDRPIPFDVPDPELAYDYFEGTSVSVLRIHESGVRIIMTGP